MDNEEEQNFVAKRSKLSVEKDCNNSDEQQLAMNSTLNVENDEENTTSNVPKPTEFLNSNNVEMDNLEIEPPVENIFNEFNDNEAENNVQDIPNSIEESQTESVNGSNENEVQNAGASSSTNNTDSENENSNNSNDLLRASHVIRIPRTNLDIFPTRSIIFPYFPDRDDEESSENSNNISLNSSTSSYSGFDSIDDSSTASPSSRDNDNTMEYNEIIQSIKKTDYKWNSAYEIMNRENGLPANGHRSFRDNYSYLFQNRFYASRLTVEKMKLHQELKKHQGCVNSLNFNKSGDLLVSGSDDLKIVLWNWAAKKINYCFKSGHLSNIFQTKFCYARGGLDIVSSSRDGQVRYSSIPPSGPKKVDSKVILNHDGAVHKISIPAENPNELLTVGEDGCIGRVDLRDTKNVERLTTVVVGKSKVPLYSISYNPLKPEFCVSGRSQYVHVYDRRNLKKDIQLMCPKHLSSKENNYCTITCAVYNNTGSEIVASYSNEDIYLFNNLCYIPGYYSHRYRGHNNRKTIKGVNFFGPHSDYIVSGSDCGNIYFWDKQTEFIVNWYKGDRSGVVNCIEPHPNFPVLATSGLDFDVKIWLPYNSEYPPPMEGLEKCVKRNIRRSVPDDFLNFSDRALFFFVHRCFRNPRISSENGPYVPDLASSFRSEDDNSSTSEESNQRDAVCSTQ